MLHNGLTSFVVSYIESRKWPKLEAFEKDAQKRLMAATEAERSQLQQQLLEERNLLEHRYEVRNWLTDAAARAGQISLVTHAAKYTHSDAKGSSVYAQPHKEQYYLSTATLKKPAVDVSGNAAALGIAKLLQTEHEGDSLLASLQRKDFSPLAELADNPEELELWIAGFNQALVDRQPASHKLAKQVYFPVEGGYHLLSPLFSSSLAQAMHERLVEARFGEDVKEANQARRTERWHPHTLTYYPETAALSVGGTKPQNISYLNSTRGGRVWLLPCQSPEWQTLEKPPYHCKSVFEKQGPFHYLARGTALALKRFLLSVQGRDNTMEIRRQRQAYIDEIIDILFNVAADIQREAWHGWSNMPDSDLKPAHQLWLDPYRSKDDELFRVEREREDWHAAIADDFAVWLNYQLRDDRLTLGMPERREWRTQQLFKQRLRDLEIGLAEDLK